MGQGTPPLPKGLRVQAPEGQAPLGWQAVWAATQRHAPEVSYQLTPPKRLDEPWRVTNFDRGQPTKRFTLLVDGYSGAPLYAHDWSSFTAFNKATAIGIPFHRGEFGWWNQAILLVFGLGVLWWLVSGWAMFFKRKRQGFLGLPRVTAAVWRHVPLPVWVVAGVLLVGMPVWAWSVAAIVAVEAVLALRASRTPALA
jgi:uncharacterized iron-regulated membrane protein